MRYGNMRLITILQLLHQTPSHRIAREVSALLCGFDNRDRNGYDPAGSAHLPEMWKAIHH
jgi:hypothetical protein